MIEIRRSCDGPIFMMGILIPGKMGFMLKHHDDVIKSVNSPHKGQWHGALMFSLICVWINGWVNNREADDLRRYRAHYDVTVIMALHLFNKRLVWERPAAKCDYRSVAKSWRTLWLMRASCEILHMDTKTLYLCMFYSTWNSTKRRWQ